MIKMSNFSDEAMSHFSDEAMPFPEYLSNWKFSREYKTKPLISFAGKNNILWPQTIFDILDQATKKIELSVIL